MGTLGARSGPYVPQEGFLGPLTPGGERPSTAVDEGAVRDSLRLPIDDEAALPEELARVQSATGDVGNGAKQSRSRCRRCIDQGA